MESIHSSKCLEWMGSRSYDIGAEIKMHFLTGDCDTFSC